MPVIDSDEAIRDRAYDLWERAGRPNGLEHVHWAEARKQIETELAPQAMPIVVSTVASESADRGSSEVFRLRSALYSPEPFSFELFGDECPAIDLAILLRAA